jgi:uncharacterized protein YbjT (DUF2867 family)
VDASRKRCGGTLQKIDVTARTTLVLGGTGKTGRRIVEQLGARNIPLAGEVALLAANVGEPFVDADDIADAAVAAFTDRKHAGQLYES